MILCLALISLFASISTNNSNVSHITHLSGMIIGLVFVYYNLKWDRLKLFFFNQTKINKNKQNRIINQNKIMREKVDKILDKLKEGGWEKLTQEEISYLNNATKDMFNDHPLN